MSNIQTKEFAKSIFLDCLGKDFNYLKHDVTGDIYMQTDLVHKNKAIHVDKWFRNYPNKESYMISLHELTLLEKDDELTKDIISKYFT